MKSRRTARFRELFNRLPEHVRRQAVAAYELFVQDPYTASHLLRSDRTRLSCGRCLGT